MKYLALILFCCVIFTTLPIFAQQRQPLKIEKLKTGAVLPGANRITERTESFVSYLELFGKKQHFSFLTRTLEIKPDSNDRAVLRVRQRYEDAAGTNTDISEISLKTLLPLSYSANLVSQKETFDFSAGKVTGKIVNIKDETRLFDVPLDEPIYNAVVLTEIIQALPLKKGYSVSFRVYNPGKQFFNLKLSVGGSEKLRTISGKSLKT